MKALKEIATTFVILFFFYAVPNILPANAGHAANEYLPVAVLAVGFLLLFFFQPAVKMADFVAHADDRYSMAAILLAGAAGQWLIQWEWIASGRPGIDPESGQMWAGLGLMIGGLVIRAVVFRKLWRRFTTAVRSVDDKRLITDGPYRLVRHPAYAGAILYTIGTGVFLGGTWSAVIVGILTIAVYDYRIRVEEQFLLRQFPGTYAAYRKRTARVFPCIW